MQKPRPVCYVRVMSRVNTNQETAVVLAANFSLEFEVQFTLAEIFMRILRLSVECSFQTAKFITKASKTAKSDTGLDIFIQDVFRRKMPFFGKRGLRLHL